MHLQKIIEKSGLRPKEAKIYISALGLGSATISEIANKSGVPRTSVQIIVRSLQQKGLFNFLALRRRKYWVAENPDKLIIDLKERETALKEILPQLRALRNEIGIKPTIKFYSGLPEIKLILNDIIETKHHILSLTSMEDAVSLLGDNFRDFIEQRFKHFLRVRFLTNRTPETLEMKKHDIEELRHTRFVPDNFELRNANFIYGDKLAILSLRKKLPAGVVIEDEDIVKTQTQLFEYVWIHSGE